MLVWLVMDCSRSSARWRWYLIRSRVFWSKRWGSLRKVSAIEATTTWNRGIPCNFFNHSQLPNNNILTIFLIKFYIISSSTAMIFDWFKVFWSKRWGSLGVSFFHQGNYGLKQGNLLQNFRNHSQLPNIFFNYDFLLTFSSFQGPYILFL